MINTTTLQGPYVFISYPRSEEVFVKRLVQDLQAHGFQVWRNETNIAPGSPDWETAIRDAVRNASAILLIASPQVTKSLYIKGELNLAKRYHPNRIYPIWMGGTEWSDCVPLDFINTQYIDMRGESYAPGLNTLVQVLRKATKHSSLNTATPGSLPTPVLDTPAPTYAAGPGGQLSVPNTSVDGIPPPPPPDSSFDYTPPARGTYTVLHYAQALKRSRAGLFAIVLLLVLALGGVGGYFAFFHQPTINSNGSNQNGTSTTGQQGTPHGSPTARGATTESLRLQFTYASVEYTISLVQASASFPDDTTVLQSQEGLVRINFKENNPMRYYAGFDLYSDIAQLLLPNGTSAPVSNARYNERPDANSTRTNNWIDFAVPILNLDLSKLVLRMGAATENQMDIPLKPNADLSKYQSKTISPNKAFQYAGINFTITAVTESLSAVAQQAAAGQVWIALTMNIVNTTSDDFNEFPEDYMRLKAGDNTSPPTAKINSTFPAPIPAQSSGTGYVVFSMPQGSTSFTLVLLAQPEVGISGGAVTFQIH